MGDSRRETSSSDREKRSHSKNRDAKHDHHESKHKKHKKAKSRSRSPSSKVKDHEKAKLKRSSGASTSNRNVVVPVAVQEINEMMKNGLKDYPPNLEPKKQPSPSATDTTKTTGDPKSVDPNAQSSGDSAIAGGGTPSQPVTGDPKNTENQNSDERSHVENASPHTSKQTNPQDDMVQQCEMEAKRLLTLEIMDNMRKKLDLRDDQALAKARAAQAEAEAKQKEANEAKQLSESNKKKEENNEHPKRGTKRKRKSAHDMSDTDTDTEDSSSSSDSDMSSDGYDSGDETDTSKPRKKPRKDDNKSESNGADNRQNDKQSDTDETSSDESDGSDFDPDDMLDKEAGDMEQIADPTCSKVHPKIKNIFHNYFRERQKLQGDVQKKIWQTKRPRNMECLQPIKMDKAAWRIIGDLKTDDEKMQIPHAAIHKGASALAQVMSNMRKAIKKNDASKLKPKKLFKLCMTSAKALGYASQQMVFRRRQAIRGKLDHKYRELCNDSNPWNDQLLGGNLQEACKEITETSKMAVTLGGGNKNKNYPKKKGHHKGQNKKSFSKQNFRKGGGYKGKKGRKPFYNQSQNQNQQNQNNQGTPQKPK